MPRSGRSLRDALLDAIVDLMQRIAQVLGGVLYFIFYCGVVCHFRLTSPVQESTCRPVTPGARVE